MSRRKRDRDGPVFLTPQATGGRVPPHELDAERAVLASALLDCGALDVVLSQLKPEHFYADAHRLILDAAAGLSAKGEPVDVITVARVLRDGERIAQVGGTKYLADLVDATPSVSNVDAHASIVLDKSRQRGIIAAAQQIAAEGYGDVGDLPEWMGQCEERVFAVTQQSHKRKPEPLGVSVRKTFARLQGTEETGAVHRIDTGFSDFDAADGWMYRGELMILAARPGMGKTALAHGMARNIGGTEGLEAFVWSGEMPRDQVADRMLAQETAISVSKIRAANASRFSDGEWTALVEGSATLDGLPITLDDTPGITLPELRSKVRRADSEARRRGRRLGAVVVDYLQKMGGEGWRMSREEQISRNTDGLKNLALEVGVPIVALSQLNRGVEGRQDKRPTLADLRESGAIEQDADKVVFVYRGGYYSRSAPQDEAELIIAKGRFCRTGIVEVGWAGWCAKFTDAGRKVARPQEPETGALFGDEEGMAE